MNRVPFKMQNDKKQAYFVGLFKLRSCLGARAMCIFTFSYFPNHFLRTFSAGLPWMVKPLSPLGSVW